MGREQSADFRNLSEEELNKLLSEAQQRQDYEAQLKLYKALLPYEERPCLALTAIKELELLLTQINKDANC